jgi:CheY-like chemotaxis protein
MIDLNLLCVGLNELLEMLCNDSAFNSIGFIIMTPVSVLGNDLSFSDIGEYAVFHKPANAVALTNAIEQLLAWQSDLDPLADEDDHVVNQDQAADEGRILLVEDNKINQEVAIGLLSGLRVQIDVANNGREGLELLHWSRGGLAYNLILMDCQMPEMDGYEATRRIRAGECGQLYQDIPIVAVTANAMSGDLEKCLEAGMSDYIKKPIDPDELEAKVLKWLHTTEGKKQFGT